MCFPLESHPSCGTNASSVMYDGHVDDILLLYCTVDYTGYWSPYMEWSRHDDTNVTTMPTIIQHNASTTSTLTLRLSPRDNSVTFSCKTAFAQSIEMKTSGIRNVPKYQYVWNHTISVLCKYLLFQIIIIRCSNNNYTMLSYKKLLIDAMAIPAQF